jgi:uncharacterized protein YerC
MKKEFKYTPVEEKLSIKVRRRLMAGNSADHIASTEGITLDQVCYLIGTTREALLGLEKTEQQETKSTEMKNPRQKITEAQKSKVLKLKKQGKTHRFIAKQTGVSLSSVDRIVNPKRGSRAKVNAKKASAPNVVAKQVKPSSTRMSKFSLFWGAFEIVKERN